MRIKVTQDTSNIESFEDFKKFASINFGQMVSAINGGISFDENITCSTVEATFTTANAEVQVSHGLNKVPTGWIVVSPTVAMQVYKGNNTDTNKFVYVKSTAVGSCSLIVF